MRVFWRESFSNVAVRKRKGGEWFRKGVLRFAGFGKEELGGFLEGYVQSMMDSLVNLYLRPLVGGENYETQKFWS
jgi:hypothetical protein